MTQRPQDWDDKTPVPGLVPRLRAVEARADVQEFTISEVGAEVKKLRAEVAEARMAHTRDLREFRMDVDRALARLTAALSGVGARADGAMRRAEDSSHDLSNFKTETRKKLMAKNFTLPTAIIVAVMLAGYFGLLIAGREVPTWLMSIVGVIGVAAAGIAPALFAPPQPPQVKP